MKKYNLDQIKNKTIIPLKINEDYRDTSKYESLLGGYRVLKEVLGDYLIQWHVERRDKYFELYDWYQEDIEDHIYLNMLEGLNSLNKEKINIIELGIGYAEPSLILAGLIDNTDLFPNIKEYYVLGADADINHYRWSLRQLKEQIKGKCDVIHSAISNYDGLIQFPQDSGNNEYGNYVGTGEEIRCSRLSTLLKEHKIDTIDILHIDIQAQELNLILDSLDLLDKINYIYIGTHTPQIHDELISIISSTGKHNIILDIPHFSKKYIDNFGTYTTEEGTWFDGIIFCELKNLI